LPVRKFLGSDPVHFSWNELSINSVSGNFVITCSNNNKARAELSYFDTDNVHVLEAAMRYMWKDGNYLAVQNGEWGK
jgi:hypothetical protein